MTGVSPVSIPRLQRDSGLPRRADGRMLPGRSPDVPFPDIVALERAGIAHRASAYSVKLLPFVRPGELAEAQLHVLRCGAGYIIPASLGRVSSEQQTLRKVPYIIVFCEFLLARK
jgi:hypothetical protein